MGLWKFDYYYKYHVYFDIVKKNKKKSSQFLWLHKACKTEQKLRDSSLLNTANI